MLPRERHISLSGSLSVTVLEKQEIDRYHSLFLSGDADWRFNPIHYSATVYGCTITPAAAVRVPLDVEVKPSYKGMFWGTPTQVLHARAAVLEEYLHVNQIWIPQVLEDYLRRECILSSHDPKPPPFMRLSRDSLPLLETSPLALHAQYLAAPLTIVSEDHELAAAASRSHAIQFLQDAEESRYHAAAIHLIRDLYGVGFSPFFTDIAVGFFGASNREALLSFVKKNETAVNAFKKADDLPELMEILEREHPEALYGTRERARGLLERCMAYLRSVEDSYGGCLSRVKRLQASLESQSVRELPPDLAYKLPLVCVDRHGVRYAIRDEIEDMGDAEAFIDYYTSISFYIQLKETGEKRPVCPFALRPFKREDGQLVDEHPQPEFRNCGTTQDYVPCKHFKKLYDRHGISY
jgi:hypothetical protein